jgi:hypothetical protein
MGKSRAALFIAGALTVLGGTAWLAGDYASRPHDPVGNTAAPFSEPGPAEIPVPYQAGVASTTLPDVGAVPPSPKAQWESRWTLLRQQLQAQQHHLTQQREEISQLRRALQTGLASTRHATAAAVRDAPADAARREQERIEQLETDFASEAVDNEWATPAVEEIAAAVRQAFDTLGVEADDESALEEAVCAQTFCRLAFTHRHQAAMQEFIRQFPRHLGWQTDGYVDVMKHQDGSVSTVVYLARDGHSLPTYNDW